MAKKKATEAAQENNYDDVVQSTIASVQKTYGITISSGRDIIDRPKMTIPMSPALDLALGGGLREGSWVTMSGPEKFGKTVTALQFAANAQKPEYGSRPVFYYAAEGRLNKRDLEGIRGLDTSPSKFTVIESTEEKILSSVDYLNIASSFIQNVKQSVHIIDSVSSLCSPRLLSEGIGLEDRGSGNKALGQFCDLMQSVVPINNVILIGIVHLIANPSGMGAGRVEKGSGRWKYQLDTWLQGKYSESWKIGTNENSEEIGKILNWQIKASPLGGPGKCVSYFRYNTGLDKTQELMNMAKDLGFIETAGSWVTLSFLDESLLKGTEYEEKGVVKVQGNEKAYELIDSNPKWVERLEKSVKGEI